MVEFVYTGVSVTSEEAPDVTSISFAEGVTVINADAFIGCTALESVSIPAGIIYIENAAFAGCSALHTVVMTNDVTFIGDNVFSGCSALTNLTLSTAITEILYSAFFNCSSLTNITLPNSATTLGAGLFEGCTSLTTVGLPSGITTIGFNMFKNCSALTGPIPSTVTEIGANAFEGCTSLGSVTISAGVTTIGSKAFDYCGLTSITYLGLNVNAIDSKAFAESGPSVVNVPSSWAGGATLGGLPILRASAPPSGQNVACFPTGTRVLTAAGYKAVESLQKTDRIVTPDGRSLPFKLYSTVIEKTTEATAPYHIPKGTIGNKGAITLSPQHAIQSAKGVWQIPRNAAKRFSAIRQVNLGERVEYFHLELPNFFTDNIVAEGNIVESFGANQARGSIYTYSAALKGCTRIAQRPTTKSLTL